MSYVARHAQQPTSFQRRTAALWRAVVVLTGAVALAGMLAVATVTGSSASATEALSSGPIRAAFFYSWFPQTWHSTDHYRPSLGQYSSDNRAVMAAQFAGMRYAGLDAAIVSWWGQGQQSEQTRLPALLQAARAAGVHLTVYYEPEGSAPPSPSQLAVDVTYLGSYAAAYPDVWLTANGKPVIFVYNARSDTSTCAEVDRWRIAAPGWYVQLKVFAGYAGCPHQPDGWHQYGPASGYQDHAGPAGVDGATEVSPGFWKYSESAPRLARDPVRFAIDLARQVQTGRRWQLMTTWNEWGESSAVETADPWQSGSGWGIYLDAMRAVYTGPQPTPSPTASGSPSSSPSPSPSPSATSSSPSPTSSPSTSPSPTPSPTGVPGFDHVVIAIFENHDQRQIVGNPNASWFNSNLTAGAYFSSSVAITHPSLPNYLALFSGSTQGVTDDGCSYSFTTANLGTQLAAAGLTYRSYSEGLPAAGSTVCTSGDYAKKHNPGAYWPATAPMSLPYTSWPADFTTLPTVSFVIPDLCDDMHDCPVATGNTWAIANLQPYATWATSHNSLLITTFDENDGSSGNRIYTVFSGAHVMAGTYGETVNQYRVLRTVEASYSLPGLGAAGLLTPITDCWAGS